MNNTSEAPLQYRGGPQGSPTIVADNISKNFGSIQALKGVSAKFYPSEVHALVGENGAGKSTFLGVLAGRISASAGIVNAFGIKLGDGNPRTAHAAGISAIYQELTMIPARPAFHNVFLGQMSSRLSIVNFEEMKRQFIKYCQEFGIQIDPDKRTDSLSISDQQILEIMRALHSGSEAILFDEPTASLGESERDRLLVSMHRLKSNGKTLVFVSHRLDEVLKISDRITVFRDGQVVSTAPTSDWSKISLVREMMGRNLSQKLHRRTKAPEKPPKEVLRLNGVSVPGLLYPVNLSIRAGEVLGVAGLAGSGRTALLRTIAGLEKAYGTVKIDGKEFAAPRSVRAAKKLGISLIPEDRKGQGLILEMSSSSNVVLSDFNQISIGTVTTPGVVQNAARSALGNYNFDPGRLGVNARTLSGGNQQKLMLGRWTHCKPRILLADEPTRGIDIGAKSDILDCLRQMAIGEGLAVVIVSSEIEEILSVADRIIVMHDGVIIDERDCHLESVEQEDLLKAAFSMHDNTPPVQNA